MAITDLRTATAINVVINWLMPASRPIDAPPGCIHDDDAYEAFEYLAEEARKKLRAGVSAAHVRQAIAVDGVRLQALSWTYLEPRA